MSDMIAFFFIGLGVLTALQLAGIILVTKGRYRLGGALQIVASVPHIIDGFGILGVIGGMIAYHYPAKEAAARSADEK